MGNKKNIVNVAYVSHFSTLKMGGQKSMSALIENLDRKIFRPYAIMPEPGELSQHLESMGCKCFYVPFTSLKPKNVFKYLRNLSAVRGIIRDNDIDIIHPDFERDAYLCGHAKNKTKAKMIWHVRLTLKKRIDAKIEKLADGIIGISDGVKQRFSGSAEFEKKYRTIFNGVDTDIFKPVEDRAELRKKLDLPKDRFILLFAGQMKEGKGILDIAEAARIIKDSIPTPPLIILAGQVSDKDVFNKLLLKIENDDCSEIVTVLPPQTNIQEWMQAADALILPSHEGTEGMGRVMFEAMACGAVAIGTDISGVREAVDEKSGILIPERSPESIAETIIGLMKNPGFAANLSENGRKRAVEVFDIRRHAENVMEFYNYILAL